MPIQSHNVFHNDLIQNVSQANRITGTIIIRDYINSPLVHILRHTNALSLGLYSRECTLAGSRRRGGRGAACGAAPVPLPSSTQRHTGGGGSVTVWYRPTPTDTGPQRPRAGPVRYVVVRRSGPRWSAGPARGGPTVRSGWSRGVATVARRLSAVLYLFSVGVSGGRLTRAAGGPRTATGTAGPHSGGRRNTCHTQAGN